MYLIKYSRTSYRYTIIDKYLVLNVLVNVDVLVNVIKVGDDVIVAKKTEGKVDYREDDEGTGDNLLFCK